MSLFEKGNSTRCDWCGDDLGTTEALDRHEGKHAIADPRIFKIGFMPRKKFHPHADVCECAECRRTRETIAEQKRDYWATMNAAA